jgi:hypothetical protein
MDLEGGSKIAISYFPSIATYFLAMSPFVPALSKYFIPTNLFMPLLSSRKTGHIYCLGWNSCAGFFSSAWGGQIVERKYR